jgi:hypothetical protein
MHKIVAGSFLVIGASIVACVEPADSVEQGVSCGSGSGSGTCTAPDGGSCPPDWPEVPECGEGRTCPPPDAGTPDAAPPTDGGTSDGGTGSGSGSGSGSARIIEDRIFDPILEPTIPLDAPGCDWFPDTVCTTPCCAKHDECYDLNDCEASSWCTGQGGDACDECNSDAVDCLLENGLIGCKINWPFDGEPRECESFPCGCSQHECYSPELGRYCADSC